MSAIATGSNPGGQQQGSTASTEATIAVRLALFADLRRYLPRGVEGSRTFSLPVGANVAALLVAAGVPPREEITIGINGELAQPETSLHQGDDVVLFSPMEGG